MLQPYSPVCGSMGRHPSWLGLEESTAPTQKPCDHVSRNQLHRGKGKFAIAFGHGIQLPLPGRSLPFPKVEPIPFLYHSGPYVHFVFALFHCSLYLLVFSANSELLKMGAKCSLWFHVYYPVNVLCCSYLKSQRSRGDESRD